MQRSLLRDAVNMLTGTAQMKLSSAFQTALGILATNTTLAREVIAGRLPLDTWDPALNGADRACMELLLRSQGQRVLALAEILTARRKGKMLSRLPMTLALLGRRIDGYWVEYLASTSIQGTTSAAAEAAAFAGWILDHLELSCRDSQLIRYELCENEVAAKLIAPCDEHHPGPLLPGYRILRSGNIKVESFDRGIDAALQRFRAAGELAFEEQGTRVEMVFHRVPGRRGVVAATRISKAMSLVLEVARTELEVESLLNAIPPARRAEIRTALEALVNLSVLERRL